MSIERVPFEDRRLTAIGTQPEPIVAGRVVLDPEPFLRQWPERLPLGNHVLPKLFGRSRVRILARHPDDGDRFVHGCTRPATAGAGTLTGVRRRAQPKSKTPAPRRVETAVRAKKSPNTT